MRDRGGARRRPGLREEGEVGEGFDLVGFDRGIAVEASLIPLEVWKKGLRVVVVDGSYWEEKVSVAGVVQQVVANGEEVQLEVDLRGTQCESLVKWKGANPGKALTIDLCRKDCPLTSKDGLVHCQLIKKLLPDAEEAWMRNLEGMDKPEDELELLRRRSEALEPRKEDKPGGRKEQVSSEESSRRSKRRKKKKNRKERKEKRKVVGTKSQDHEESPSRGQKEEQERELTAVQVLWKAVAGRKDPPGSSEKKQR